MKALRQLWDAPSHRFSMYYSTVYDLLSNSYAVSFFLPQILFQFIVNVQLTFFVVDEISFFTCCMH